MSEFLSFKRRGRLFLWRNRRFILLASALFIAALLVVLTAPGFWLWGVSVGILLVMFVAILID